MNKNLYFNGQQIKNYLIGFASLFSEIPYKDRVGNIKIVPIHYGSPSDVISYLENDVDNEATANRNRLKDVSVPMFSFRMTGLERNSEKRRFPHDTMTVDLRPMGYNVGYITMWPSPYRFTMELVCWASSDYQAFEITEQIIPYFNSPQQVVIEPLPRCRVSTTEIFLDSVDIDTDPESQKYSALITMTFSLTGYILTQPKIWSTNLQFELSMLDSKTGDNITSIGAGTDYSVGNEIRDLSKQEPTKLPSEDKFSSIESFIKNTPLLLAEYGEKLDLYKILVKNERIDNLGNVIDTTELVSEYKGEEKIFYPITIQFIADEIEDVRYIFENEKLESYLKSLSIEGTFKAVNDLINDTSETISIFSILLDNNLVSSGFNPTGVTITNSEKLLLFGSISIDTNNILERLRSYLAALQTLKISKYILSIKYSPIYKDYSVFLFENKIPYDYLPTDVKPYIESSYLTDNETLLPLEVTIYFKNDNIIIKTEPNIEGKIILETQSGINVSDFSTNDTSNEIIINSDNILLNKTFGIILKVDGRKTNIYGVVIRYLKEEIDIASFDFRVFGLSDLYNIGLNSLGESVSFELDKGYYNLFEYDYILNYTFKEIDSYLISMMVYNILQNDTNNSHDILNIITSKYKITYNDIVKKANTLKHFVVEAVNFIDIDNISIFSEKEIVDKQQTVVDGVLTEEYTSFAQAISFDNDGKPIYDINKDGFINKTDIELLNANVDNPDDYDYELVNGIWYKRYKLEDIDEEKRINIMKSLKVIFYILEKNDYVEIYDYLFLLNKNLIASTFSLFTDTVHENNLVEIESLGYEKDILDNKLLFLRMFLDSLKCILIDDAKYIIYKIKDLSDISKKLLMTGDGLNLDNIIIGKYIELYLGTFNDFTRLDKEFDIRELIDKPLGMYFDYTYEFNVLIRDIFNSGLFLESLEVESQDLDELLPNIKQQIEDKYLQQ